MNDTEINKAAHEWVRKKEKERGWSSNYEEYCLWTNGFVAGAKFQKEKFSVDTLADEISTAIWGVVMPDAYDRVRGIIKRNLIEIGMYGDK